MEADTRSPSKKKWIEPEISLISSCDIENGMSVDYHEKTLQAAPVVTVAGIPAFHTPGGGYAATSFYPVVHS